MIHHDTLSKKDLEEAQAVIMNNIRARTPPVAIKFLKSADKLPDAIEVVSQTRGFEPAVCHLHSIARHEEKAVAGFRPNMSCAPGMILMGMFKPDAKENIADLGKPSFGLYVKDLQKAQNFSSRGYFIPGEEHEGIVMAPLEKTNFEPDLVIQYGNPAQILKLIRGYIWESGKHLDMICSGRAGLCSEGIARAFIEKKPVISIPAGDRQMGFTQDEEMAFSIPFALLPTMIAGLRGQAHIELLKYPPIPYIADNCAIDLGKVPNAGIYYEKWLKEAKEKFKNSFSTHS